MEDTQPEEESAEAPCPRFPELDGNRPPDEKDGDDLRQDQEMTPALPWKAAVLLQASSSDDLGQGGQGQQAAQHGVQEDAVDVVAHEDSVGAQQRLGSPRHDADVVSVAALPADPDDSAPRETSAAALPEDVVKGGGQDVAVPRPLEDAVDDAGRDVSAPRPVQEAVEDVGQCFGAPEPREDAVDGDGQGGGAPEPPEGTVDSGAQESTAPSPREHLADDADCEVGVHAPARETGLASAPSSANTFKCDDLETDSAYLPDDVMDTDQVKDGPHDDHLAASADPPPPAVGRGGGSNGRVTQGLQGALPSEADLIRALRRHCCWVCGAAALSHDANISHMLTHLQTPAPGPAPAPALAPAPVSSPVSSDTSLAEEAAMPLLGASPSGGHDPLEDRDGEDTLEGHGDGAPSWPPPLEPAPLLYAEHAVDRGTLAPPAPADEPPCSRPAGDAAPDSEVGYSRRPPRFSYAARTGGRVRGLSTPRALTPSSPRACPQPASPRSPSLPPAEAVDVKMHVPDGAPTARVEHQDAALVCAICLQLFPSRAVLLEHVAGEVRAFGLQARRGRKARTPPTTPVAQRSLSSQGAASASASHPRHVKAGDARPHACRLCPMRFRRHSHLQQHTLVHTGEKPFKCHQCGESFRRKDRLVLHVKQHKQQRKSTPGKATPGKSTPGKDNGKPGSNAELVSKAQAVAEVKSEAPERPEVKPVPSSSKTLQKQSVLTPRAVRAALARAPGGVASEAPAAAAAAVLGKPEARGALEPSPSKRGRGRPRKAEAGAALEAKVAELSRTRLLSQAAALRCLACGKAFPAKGKLRQHVLKAHAATVPHVCLTCGQGNASREVLLKHVAEHIQDRVRERAVKKGLPQPGAEQDKQAVKPAEDDVRMEVDEGEDTSQTGLPSPIRDAPAAPTASASAPSVPRPELESVDSQAVSAAPADAPIKPKTQPRVVVRVVSRHGVKDAASVAAKFLPQLARDLASKGTLQNLASDSKNRKVVYMMMSKVGSDDTSQAVDTAGHGSTPASTGTKRKVILKVVSKKRPVQECTDNTPEQPKQGFKVVSRIVPVDGSSVSKAVAVSSPKPVVPAAAPLAGRVAADPPATGCQAAVRLDGLDVLQPQSGTAVACPEARADPCIEGAAARDDLAERAARPATRMASGMRLKSSPPATAQRSAPWCPTRGTTSLVTQSASTPPASRGIVRSSPRTPLRASPQANVDTKVLATAKADSRFLCEKCGGRFLGESAYLQHVRSHGMKQMKAYQCHCCYVKFFDKELLKAHMHTHL